MTNTFLKQAAPGIAGLSPYQPGKPIAELQREYGVKQVVKLASNENPLGPSPKALQAIEQEARELTRYPDGNGYVLKSMLARHFGVELKHITLGNGSNDILEIIARTFASEGDEIIYSQHAFAVYPIVTQAINAKHVVTKAKQWGHDLDAMLAAVTPSTKIIFIANPNNPTGTWLTRDALKTFLEHIDERVIVVVDEAYFEYAAHPLMNAPDYPTALSWLSEYHNIIVTRTFSKAYGLAGLRVGYAISHADIAELLNRLRQPFNVNSFALAAAAAALTDAAYLEESVRLNAAGMGQITRACDALGLHYIPSVGNFVSIDVGTDAAPVYEKLLREGVIVRPVANYGMPNFLRVSVGTEQENTVFINALNKIVRT